MRLSIMRVFFVFFLLLPAIFAVAEDIPRLKFSEIYLTRMEFSEKVHALEGKKIIVKGFMAPPLKPDANFFVLTKMPMAVCPFCDNETDWPDDIILVKLKGALKAVRFNKPIEVKGLLELGVEVDEDTGFVSLMRIVKASFRVL